MNKILITAAMPWLFAAVSYKALAQETVVIAPEPKKETQEIIIRKKGEKDVTVNVEFKNDKVFINGKPLVEFKDDEIIVNDRKIKLRQLESDFEGFGRGMDDFGREMELAFGGDNFKGMMAPMKSGTFLGVSTEDNDAGAIIVNVIKGSAAEKAGLKDGDIITKIDDKKVTGPGELAEIIGAMEPKKTVTVSYKRDGKIKTAKATLQERKESDVRSYSITTPKGDVRAYSLPRTPGAPYPAMPPGNFEWNNGDKLDLERTYSFSRGPKLGLKIQDLEEGDGVKVLEVEAGSAAEKAGLKKDDVIVEIGAVKVKNTDEAREQLHENGSKSSYPVVAKRNNVDMKFDIKIPKKLKTANL